MFRLASVAMNGLTPITATSSPLNSPTASPIPSPAAMPSASTHPAGSSPKPVSTSALATLTADTVVPSERSKPRVRITSVCATVSTNR